MLTSASASCHDVNARRKHIHTLASVVKLVHHLPVTLLWWIELIRGVTTCHCNSAIHIGWSDGAGIDPAVACGHHHSDAVLLYQVRDRTLQGLGPFTGLIRSQRHFIKTNSQDCDWIV